MATKLREQIAVAPPSSSHPNPLISHEKLRQLYSTMLKCRLLYEQVGTLIKKPRFEGDYASSVGQEATSVGTAIDLRREDTIALQHRDFILNYVKGVPLTALFSQLHEHHRSPNGGHSAPDICGYAQLDMCTDIALANQRKKNDHVVVAFCGEGSNSLGFWHEALSFAGVRNLPIVFVCENNWSAEPDSVELEGDVDDINLKAAGYGFPGITVDGNDAVAMYRVAQEAIERARCGGGPTLIEAKTFPRYGPTEIDHAQYRVTDEVEDCESIDPITVMERYLTGKGLFSQGWKKELVAAFQQELDAAIYAAEIDRCGASA